MTPVVVLDSNAFFGRKPFTQANSAVLLALAKAGDIRLIVPEVVLYELARQWQESIQEQASNARTALKKLNESLSDIKADRVEVTLPHPDRDTYSNYVRVLLDSHRAEIPQPPEVSTGALLQRDLATKKPFARGGTGFRDALIWETVLVICRGLGDPATPVIFVTNNTKDFWDKNGLHPDLQADLVTANSFRMVTSIHALLEDPLIEPLVKTLRDLQETFTPQRVFDLVDAAIADLYGADVDSTLGVYVGDGMTEVPIGTGLDDATFNEIMFDEGAIASDIFRTGDDFTLRVTVDVEATFEGFIDKYAYYADENDGVVFLEDWNDHVFRASTQSDLRLTLSGAFTEDTRDGVTLTLDEAEQL